MITHVKKTPLDYSNARITVCPEIPSHIIKKEITQAFKKAENGLITLDNCDYLPDSVADTAGDAVDKLHRERRINEVLSRIAGRFDGRDFDDEQLSELSKSATEIVNNVSQLTNILTLAIQSDPENFPEIMALVRARIGGSVTNPQAAGPLPKAKLDAMAGQVAALSESDAATLFLVKNHKLSQKVVADVLNCSDQTVGNLTKKLKQRMAEKLSARQQELPIQEFHAANNHVGVFDQVPDLLGLLTPREHRSPAGRKTLEEAARIAVEKAAIAARQIDIFAGVF